jgi:hypothetical protein
MEEIIITAEYLRSHPNEIFVFGDNNLRKGKGGAAFLRDEKNVYGFITKKYPSNDDDSFYRPDEYENIYWEEIQKLRNHILIFNGRFMVDKNENIIDTKEIYKIFLISKLGAGRANRYHIFEEVIEPNIKKDLDYENVKFLW